MKFEEEYKKRFQGEQSIDNVNVDDIWNNVSKQLDAQKAGVSNKSKRKFLFILGFIGLFFITGTFLWLDHVPSSEVSSSIL